MKNIIAGYVVHSHLKNVSAEQAQILDIINVAFAHCVNSRISFEHEEDLIHLKRIRAYNPDIKILFSVGGWGSGGFSPMASTEQTRRIFAESCLEFALKYSLDGIDIDWEYPCLDWAEIEASPDDKENFSLMLEEMRRVFDESGNSHLMLTIAVGNDSYFIENTQMDRVAKCLDYVSVMTYDMRGCSDKITGHHTNVYKYADALERRAHRSAEHSVEIYTKAGVPANKLVIGGAFYSRMWKNTLCENGVTDGLSCKADPGNYGPSYAELKEGYIDKNGFSSYYDEKAGAAYLFDGSTFISYDNELSLKEKCRFVKEKGLLGVMYWEHSCDVTGELLNALKDGMSEPNPVNEYTVTKKLTDNWTRQARFMGINRILLIIWSVLACINFSATLLAIRLKMSSSVIIYAAITLICIYKLFFERRIISRRQYAFYAKTYGTTDWTRRIEFSENDIMLSECSASLKIPYSSVIKTIRP